ncbi:glutamine dumper 3 [Perilla frutescens var. hirtella]|uniref:Glutamine dumper 3 n=1 Tax=Perilla frutescens var. hirtella TaxID=608512 RepID=A0AAD4PEI1_PERFH|nr:glutamine dumper 3 [Perilla frutescens var. hirtella]KAH6836291.1 glutamine dumper 3 [Perilla frutescens var. hirtella]
MTTADATTTAKATFSPPATIQRSPWHSPVPYLFGGLAAMLGLIAFALLILACSYWKLSAGEEGREGDVESGAAEKGDSGSAEKALPVFEEKFLVIMAGEVKPTFLATPMSSRNTSFNDDKIQDKEMDQQTIKTKEDHNEEAADQSQLTQEQNHSNHSS